MRSLFSRSPDLEGGQNRSTYKKGFTGDHRGRTHIPPNPSPLFSPHAQHSPFSVPSASYRHDTIFRPPPSPSPKSGTFSEREWGVGMGEGEGNGGASGNGLVDERSGLDRLDQEQLARLHEYLGVLPARGTGIGTGIGTPPSGRRGFSMSDPNDRDRALRISPTSVPASIPPPAALPTPLSPHSRLKKNLKHQVAEQQFRSNRNGSVGCGCECDVLGDEDKEVHYHSRVFREALRNALGGVQREMGVQGVGSGDRDKDKNGDVEGRKPVMQRRGASEGVREGGFTGPMERERKEDVSPRDLKEFLEEYDPRPEDLPDVYPMGEHRAMLRTMYLEDILHATAKLHMHNWILLSRNEKYEDLRIPARWDQIQEDLEKYTRSIRNYTYWLRSPMALLELPRSSLPPRFHLYGKQLAILECARAWNLPPEREWIGELERKLVAYQTDWSVSNGVWAGVRRGARRRGERGGSGWGRGVGRFVGGVVGGGSILAPISILILWPGGISHTAGVGIIGVSVAIMGIILVWIMDGGGEHKSGWEGMEGERGVDGDGDGDGDGKRGFLGGGEREWGVKGVMLVLGAYAAVLAVFLGVAVL